MWTWHESSQHIFQHINRATTHPGSNSHSGFFTHVTLILLRHGVLSMVIAGVVRLVLLQIFIHFLVRFADYMVMIWLGAIELFDTNVTEILVGHGVLSMVIPGVQWYVFLKTVYSSVCFPLNLYIEGYIFC